MNKVLIDIPMPENCEDCLICSLVPEHARWDMREHGLQYRLYCKVTGACVSKKGRDKACPLHERKKGKWIMKYKGSAVTSYKCSECGRTVKDDTGYDVSKDYPFCHCGADMREGVEQE